MKIYEVNHLSCLLLLRIYDDILELIQLCGIDLSRGSFPENISCLMTMKLLDKRA